VPPELMRNFRELARRQVPVTAMQQVRKLKRAQSQCNHSNRIVVRNGQEKVGKRSTACEYSPANASPSLGKKRRRVLTWAAHAAAAVWQSLAAPCN